MKRLENKIAVITGGGSGIGRSIALRFAQEGAKVAILELNAKNASAVIEQIQNDGGQAQSYQCDVSKQSSVRECFEEIKNAYGRLDILINNAGIAGCSTKVEAFI